LDRIDTKIRRVKELMRSVVSGLPFRVPRGRVKDLVTYAVGCLKLRSTEMLMSPECPRVRFTGQRPEYSTELALVFGDYVEVYNPKEHARSNDVFVPRTEPCMALYPAVNTKGSWVMFNLNTKSYVKRPQWRKCTMSDGIIKVMNDMAGETGVQVADIVHEGFDVTASDVLTNRLALHHPVIMDVLDDTKTEEDMLADVADDPTLPELEDATDDSGSVTIKAKLEIILGMVVKML
jgi:hypothetical protein